MKLPFPVALLLLLAGVGVALAGLAMVYVPAAMVVGGIALAVGVWRGVDV